MAGLKDIKRRIRSVKNTKKITYAMKLVSAAKLKKAQDAVQSSREYTDSLLRLLAQVKEAAGGEGLSHALLEPKSEVKKIRIVVVGGSRGLCGAYNANVNKQVESVRRTLLEESPEREIDFVSLGKKPNDYLKRKKYEIVKSYVNLPEEGNDWPIDEVCGDLEEAFLNGEVDRVYVVYAEFASAMSQTMVFHQLLPLSADSVAAEAAAEDLSSVKVIFEPSPQAVFQALIPRILRTQLRQAALDAKASEYGSRMVAMDSATKNAGELAEKLTLTHNKLRQTAITAELLDIIGGAEAISD